MSVKVSSSLKVTLPGNTIFEDVVNLTEDAYDVIEVLLPKLSSDVEVSVFPTGGIVGLFFIKSSSYLDGTKLSYRPGSAEADPVPLANAHLYSGTGQVSVLENPPTSLFLSNSDNDTDVTITIVAARDATP